MRPVSRYSIGSQDLLTNPPLAFLRNRSRRERSSFRPDATRLDAKVSGRWRQKLGAASMTLDRRDFPQNDEPVGWHVTLAGCGPHGSAAGRGATASGDLPPLDAPLFAALNRMTFGPRADEQRRASDIGLGRVDRRTACAGADRRCGGGSASASHFVAVAECRRDPRSLRRQALR